MPSPRAILVPLLFLVLVVGCGGKPNKPGEPPSLIPPATPAIGEGWKLVLETAPNSAPRVQSASQSTPLSAERTQLLLAPLEPLPRENDTSAPSFKKHAPPKATPRPDPFQEKPSAEANELRVERVTPNDGEEPVSHITVVFSEPMISLGQEQQNIATLTPQPPGRWRWLGTKTLIFEPEAGFPKATSFQLELNSQTPSAGGNKLPKSVLTTFQTPTNKLKTTHLTRSPDYPLLALEFSQPADPKEALALSELRDSSGKMISLSLASEKEQARHPDLKKLMSGGSARYVVLKTDRPLLYVDDDTYYDLVVKEGLGSQEGPTKTDHSQSEPVYPNPPLSVSTQVRTNRPGEGVAFYFNSELAELEPGWVRVQPEVDRLRVGVDGSALFLIGDFRGSTDYKVTVSSELRDIHGLKLTAPLQLAVKTEEAEPDLQGPSQTTILVTPEDLNLTVFTAGSKTLKLQAFPPLGDEQKEDERQIVWSKEIPLDAEATGGKMLSLDISGAFHGQASRLAVEVQAQDCYPVYQELLKTRLGISSIGSHDRVFLLVRDLITGEAVKDVALEIDGKKTQTDAAGRATLEGLSSEHGPLHASLNDDAIILTEKLLSSPPDNSLRWTVLDERGLYRPGQRVHVKGWLRQPSAQGLTLPLSRELTYSVSASDGQAVAKGSAAISERGSFDLNFELPTKMALGECEVEFATKKSQGEPSQTTLHSFEVQEYKRPTFELSTSASPGPHILKEPLWLEVEAGYFNGSKVNGSQADWELEVTPSYFYHRDWWGYSFGPHDPEGPQETRRYEGVTGPDGRHRLQVQAEAVWPPWPYRIRGKVKVRGRDRNSWNTSHSTTLHPAAEYVGLKPTKDVVATGEPLEFDLVVVDLEGKPIPGRAVALVMGETFRARTARTVTSEAEPMRLTLPAQDAGRHMLTAYVRDAQQRWSASELEFRVGGVAPDDTREDDDSAAWASLTSDKEHYQPGDTAQLTLSSPFPRASGQICWSVKGELVSQPLLVEDSKATLSLPIESWMLPSLKLDYQLAEKGGSGFVEGSETLDLFPHSNRLEVDIQSQTQAWWPGQQAEVTLLVTDQAGQPVPNSEVLFWAVDDSLFALKNYQVPSPLDEFLRPFMPDARRFNIRSYWPEEIYRPEAHWHNGVVYSRGANRSKSVRVRDNFDPLVTFQPKLVTDHDGKTTARFQVPDNLTRYKMMAIASEGVGRFGKSESQILSATPLAVKPSPPRFLLEDDSCVLPVLVSNQTEQAMQVEVALRASGVKMKPTGFSLDIPATSTTQVEFPVTAEQSGQAHFQAVATSPNHSDAAQFAFPVHTADTRDSKASYGVLRKGVTKIPIQLPPVVDRQRSSISLSTSASALSDLEGGVSALRDYPYDCGEQTASKLLGLLSTNAPAKETTPLLDRLLTLQRFDGGWRYWDDSNESHPFVSVHAAHALVRAQRAGLKLPGKVLDDANAYLKSLDQLLSEDYYEEEPGDNLRAYALYVLALQKRKNVPAAARLLKGTPLKKHPAERLAWLLAVFPPTSSQASEIRQTLLNRVTENAGQAHLVKGSSEEGTETAFYSQPSTDAIFLEALGADRSSLPSKIVRGMLSARRNGNWGTTLGNAWSLTALSQYLASNETQNPNFKTRAWLGDLLVNEQSFQQRDQRQSWSAPLSSLENDLDLTLSKTGPGLLYYRLGLDLRSPGRTAKAKDQGIAVTREYFPVENPGDVTRDSEGTWHIKAGSLVKVVLSLASPKARFHVAAVDRFPGGFEAVNPSLTPEELPTEGRWNYRRRWHSRRNLRDDRVELFADRLSPGLRTHTYYVKATTVGDFVAPPARAEEMYSPEVFGRSASDHVLIEQNQASGTP